MNRRFLVYLILFLMVVSCAGNTKKDIEKQLAATEDAFNYTDKNGRYGVKLSSNFEKKTKTVVTKKVMEIPNRQKDKVLEQSVAISSVGSIKKKGVILRPKISQYSVWFEGKKYSSELKINTSKRAIDVKMTSPETQWNGSKQIKFPSSTMFPCFFSQVIECAKVTGFIEKASKKKSGTMNILIIWEGYPYLNETFSDFPSELFSEAELEYDGLLKNSERRFNLRVGGQSIFYVLNEKDNMLKMFWVTQGISMVSKSVSKEESELENEDGGGFE